MKLKLLELIDSKNLKAKYIDEEGYYYCLSLNKVDEEKLGHKKFSKNNPYTIENIRNYIKNSKITTELISSEYLYASNKNYLTFRCGNCGKEFKRTWNHFYNGKYKLCQDCIVKIQSKEKYFTLEQIKEKCLTKGFKVIQENYYGNREPLDVEDIDGYRGRTTWNDIQNGKHFIKFRIGNPYFYYNIRNYFRINNYNCNILENSGNERRGKFTFICECGKHYDSTLDEVINNTKPRIRCKSCNNAISSGERAIIDWLKKNKVNFKYQCRFADCRNIKPLPFDFYLPEYNTCIEFDGAYHYKKQPHVTEEQFKEQCKRDKIKDDYCKNNGIKLIRIPYWTLYNKKYKNILIKNILM
nr:MAG TPA: restriction enzyme [Caudoviricetes sp.]